jgi:transposase-like protein
MLKNFDSLLDLFRAFPNEQACLKHLREMRWRNGEFCPYCGHDKIYEFSDRRSFKCAQCKQRFSLKVGTIFEDTKLPLRKWFAAIWLITNHPKGIASTTLAKDLKVTQKTAWFVLHRLRHASRTKAFNAPLSGIIEIDETYIGRGPRGGKGSRGHTVIGAAERKGKVIGRAVPFGLGHPEAQKFVDDVVSPDAKMVVTDSHPAYRSLTGIEHAMVNHSAGEGRSGEAHTQTIESVWAQLKRQIVGIHHWVSPKHLQKYVDEMAWRMSRRGFTVTSRMNALFTEIEGPLPYKILIAKS